MILLRLISWPYFRKHILRTLLTTAGIVLGVAVFVGMHTANQSVLYAFNRTVDRIAGKTELQVSAGETGFNEEVLETVQSAPTVRVAVPVIEAVVDSRIEGQGSLLVLGTDMTGDRSLRDYDLEDADQAIIDDPLVFLAQPDSLMLTKSFAEKNRIAVNSRITLGTVLGPREFTVRGIMRASGLSSAFGGNLAIMDIYAAQKMFGRGRTFDRIDLAPVRREFDQLMAEFASDNNRNHFERNDEFIGELEIACEAFWHRHVIDHTPPEIDASVRTLEAIKKLHPKDNGATVKLADEAAHWFATMAAAKEAAQAALEMVAVLTRLDAVPE